MGAAWLLRPGSYSLGRDQGDIIFPQDGFISGRHAILEVQDGRATIRDVGSSNGTFIRLTGPVAVENGDQFLVGRELVRVEVRPP
jgi:pSer/pThr/pTyr-binding forkhead associated (FHA) protein